MQRDDLCNSLRDAGYVVLGAGVLGWQRARQERGRRAPNAPGQEGTGFVQRATATSASFARQASERGAGVARQATETVLAGAGIARQATETVLAGASSTGGAVDGLRLVAGTAAQSARDLTDRASGIAGQVLDRVEPVIEQIQANLAGPMSPRDGQAKRATSEWTPYTTAAPPDELPDDC